MKKKTITLFGGEFHRQQIEIDSNMYSVSLPVRTKMTVMTKELHDAVFHVEPLKVCTYIRNQLDFDGDIIGEYYLLDGMCPHRFMKNILLDYLK